MGRSYKPRNIFLFFNIIFIFIFIIILDNSHENLALRKLIFPNGSSKIKPIPMNSIEKALFLSKKIF